MITINADALFRAVTATGYKVLAYHLDLQTGAITSRTLRPDEVQAAPEGPSVKPLPKLGGDLSPKKDASPFGAPPVESKKKLFGDEDLPKKKSFDGDFWKRDDSKKAGLFAEEFKRESGSKKLAELFGGPPEKKKIELFAKEETPAEEAAVTASIGEELPDPARCPRIPFANEEKLIFWMDDFSRNCGDPEIRDLLLAALQSPKPIPSFEKTLRRYQRMNQQWDRYFRKQALEFAEAWLSDLGISWELVES